MPETDGLSLQEREFFDSMKFIEGEAEDSSRRWQIIAQKMRDAGMTTAEIEAYHAQRNIGIVKCALSILFP